MALMQERDVLRYVAHEASELATTAVQRTNNQWRIVWTMLIAVLGFLGYNNISEIIAGPVKDELAGELEETSTELGLEVRGIKLSMEEFRAQVNRRVQSEVADARSGLEEQVKNGAEGASAEFQGSIDNLREELRTGLALVALQRLSLVIEDKDSFTVAERDVIMEQLARVVESSEARGSAEFVGVLRSVVSTFVSADLDHDLDRIDLLAGDVATEYPRIAIQFLGHYGMRLVGEVLGESSWGEEDLSRFDKYLSATMRHGYPEAAIPWRIFVESIRADSERTPGIDRLVRSVKFLTLDEQAMFHLAVIQYSDPTHFSKVVTANGDRVSSVARGFVLKYAEDLDRLLDDGDGVEGRLTEMANSMALDAPPLATAVNRTVSLGYSSLL